MSAAYSQVIPVTYRTTYQTMGEHGKLITRRTTYGGAVERSRWMQDGRKRVRVG
jgi:hypothetical protein